MRTLLHLLETLATTALLLSALQLRADPEVYFAQDVSRRHKFESRRALLLLDLAPPNLCRAEVRDRRRRAHGGGEQRFAEVMK